MKKTKQSSTSTDFTSRPLLNSAGNILNDVELCRTAIKKIDEYQKRKGVPAPISPDFVQFMREAVEYVDKEGGSIVDYKKSHIQQQFDYDVILKNTEARNAELERKGLFNSRVVQKIKGESR